MDNSHCSTSIYSNINTEDVCSQHESASSLKDKELLFIQTLDILVYSDIKQLQPGSLVYSDSTCFQLGTVRKAQSQRATSQNSHI